MSGGHELLGGDSWRAAGHGPGTRQSQDEVVQHCPPHPAPQIHICGDRSLLQISRKWQDPGIWTTAPLQKVEFSATISLFFLNESQIWKVQVL